MFTFMRPAHEFDGQWAEVLEPYTGPTVICIGFSSTLVRLYERFPAALERTGSTTALIHLDRLR